MKNRDLNSLIIKGIIAIILILYVFFIYIDFYDVKFYVDSSYIKYSCILLCFLLSILSTKYSFIDIVTDIVNHRDLFLFRLAISVTVIADLCLVILDFSILGVVFFSFVQIIYCIRYTTKKLKETLINFFIIFENIVLLYMVASLFIEKINILLPISLFYCICLITSVIKAIKTWKNNLYPSPSKYIIVFGMILFLLSDICVALSNITEVLPLVGYLIGGIQPIAGLLVWILYLPSQLLLSLSGSEAYVN